MQGLNSSCCGMLFNSRGFKEAAAAKGAELEAALLKASNNGTIPIVCDTSPCLAQIKSSISEPSLRYPATAACHSLHQRLVFHRKFLQIKTTGRTRL